MKKSELIKIIKEELQKQRNLKEYSALGSVSKEQAGKRHEANDKLMIELLGAMLEMLREIARNTAGRSAGE
tara:strand:- start:1429 stop:1641 length:213 start_codon:yes stop_codon:yes gene_type:complete